MWKYTEKDCHKTVWWSIYLSEITFIHFLSSSTQWIIIWSRLSSFKAGECVQLCPFCPLPAPFLGTCNLYNHLCDFKLNSLQMCHFGRKIIFYTIKECVEAVLVFLGKTYLDIFVTGKLYLDTCHILMVAWLRQKAVATMNCRMKSTGIIEVSLPDVFYAMPILHSWNDKGGDAVTAMANPEQIGSGGEAWSRGSQSVAH
jgi:hypothetical protein